MRGQTGRFHWWVAVFGAAALLLVGGGGALAFGPGPLSTWVVSGGVFGGGGVGSIAVSGSTAYVGGDFTYMGPDPQLLFRTREVRQPRRGFENAYT